MSTRRAWSILGNSQRLDGGAMFGNAPRVVWQRWVKPDDLNRIPLACRALLVQDNDRLVLFETGIGSFFAPPLRERFGVVEDEHVLLRSLAEIGFAHTDIDVVVLSHLHFDHAGGLLTRYREGSDPALLFPNASYIVSEVAWERANRPHERDRASFIPALQPLLKSSGRLHTVSPGDSNPLGEDYAFIHCHGHTPGLLVTKIRSPRGPIAFVADLIPGTAWMHLPISMGYDRNPELLVDEKKRLLTTLEQEGGRVFFTHDPATALARVYRAEDGRFSVREEVPVLNGESV